MKPLSQLLQLSNCISLVFSKISEILQAWPNCHLHVDATQAVGKIPVSFEGVDTMSLTAHKFYGLNGIGLLIKRRNLALEPLIHGGESTTIYRSGTYYEVTVTLVDQATGK